jgi:hypothetical protein
MEIVITPEMNKKIGKKLVSKYTFSEIFEPMTIHNFEKFIVSTRTLAEEINKAKLITETIKQVKQCNSCGAVGKINSNCEYCGNIVY